MAAKTWRACAYLRAPLFQEVDDPSWTGGLPPALGLARPILDSPVQVSVTDGVVFVVSPFVPEGQYRMAYPGAPLYALLDVEQDDVVEASTLLSEVEVYLEELCDQLSFWWTYPVEVYQIELLDLTAPVKVGETRASATAVGFATPKFRALNFALPEAQWVGPSPDFANLDEPLRAALRWYSVGLVRQPDAQRFVALWIALELIIKSRVPAVQQPYRAPCGHNIAHCPTCDATTSRSVGGEQIKAFLIGCGGVDEACAARLWRARQVVHGRNKLNKKDVASLPTDTGLLFSIVQRVIGQELGLTSAAAASEPMGTNGIIVVGKRKVTTADLDPSERTFPKFSKPRIRVEVAAPPSLPAVLPSGTTAGD